MRLLADFLVLCNRLLLLLLLWRHPQAVVSVNMLVRQKGTEAGLTEGVWSLVQQYEGQLVGMTQYVLQETLPGLTHYVESRASDFLVSHNLSKVRAVLWRGVFGVSVVCVSGVWVCVDVSVVSVAGVHSCPQQQQLSRCSVACTFAVALPYARADC